MDAGERERRGLHIPSNVAFQPAANGRRITATGPEGEEEFQKGTIVTLIGVSGAVDGRLAEVWGYVGTGDDCVTPPRPGAGIPVATCDGEVCGMIDTVATNGVDGYTTYDLSMKLGNSGNLKTIYTIFGDGDDAMEIPAAYQEAVSYTHLTLPTKA